MKQIIKEYLLSRAEGVFRVPSGDLNFPYLDPGAGYSGELWDWDSYWAAHALLSVNDSQSKHLSERAAEYAKGSVLNFLYAQEEDGYTPVMVASGGLFEGYFHNEYQKGTPLNQHKPFLCQAILNVSAFTGDYGWFDLEKALNYLCYYETRQFDARSGLFIWQDDIMVGIDNNPTVFFRPPRSCADIFLNCFLYLEYKALASILTALHDERAAAAEERANALKAAINAEMWDERDGIYYSQDVGFCRTERKVKDVCFHEGFAPHWKTLPLKIRFWGCFLPLYAGICNAERAERLCAHLKEKDVFAAYGIRTLARNEKMYSLEKSGNPSNWLGAIWTIANYCIYKGLLRYGKNRLAERLRRASVALAEKSLREHGDLFESYHPDTGEPYLHAGFLSWNLLLLEMEKEQ